jgi:2-methylisocitrate lyase-like PEP mutase family enzyme
VQDNHVINKNRSVGIGIHNPLGALLAAKHRFDFAWVSSFELSASIGLPDIGLAGETRVQKLLDDVRHVVPALSVILDFDSTSDDPVYVHNVIRQFARAGASAISVEDNDSAKRSSLYDGYQRHLADIDKQCDRIAAAACGAESTNCRIIARTEALVAGDGVSAAIQRAHRYVDSGACAVFVQSLHTAASDLLEFLQAWERRTPVFVSPTRYPSVPNETLYRAGITHIIYANQGIRTICHAVSEVFGRLRGAPNAGTVEHLIAPVMAVNELAGEAQLRHLEDKLTQRERTVL